MSNLVSNYVSTKLASCVEDSMIKTLGKVTAESLKFHLKNSYKLDLYESYAPAVTQPRLFENALTDILGSSAQVLLERVNRDIIDCYISNRFGMDSESHLYRKFGDYLSLVSFIRNSSSLDDFVLELKDQDHIALLYDSMASLKQIFRSFVGRGTNKNQLNVVFVSAEESPHFMRSFHEREYQSLERVNSQVNFKNTFMFLQEQLYQKTSDYSFEPIMEALYSAKKKAEQDGKTGLNVLGTLPANLLRENIKDYIRLEKSWHDAIHNFAMPVTLICPYPFPIPNTAEILLAECHNKGIQNTSTSV